MESTAYRAIAIVGLGAVLPDAMDVPAFWQNVTQGRYSISEVLPERWDPALYFDSDHSAPDKTYSKIGGWVRDWKWEPAKWRLPIPPRVVDAMDEAQRWAIACTREALEDFGYPGRPLNTDRTAVILGNAMAGEKHYLTALRVYFPEYASQLSQSAAFAVLPEAVRERDHARVARSHRPAHSRHYGRHHARRIGELHRRPHRQRLQLPRPQLRRGCRMRIGDGGDQFRGRGSDRERLSTWRSPVASTATWAPQPT